MLLAGAFAVAGCGGGNGKTSVPSGPTPIPGTPPGCQSPDSLDSILVDASHDGGVWWFPQVAPFNPSAGHQGQALAAYLRCRGYHVDEVARDSVVARKQLLAYRIVLRAGNYGPYTADELSAYTDFVSSPRTLVLLGEFLRPGERDEVAEGLGIPLTGWVDGNVTRFTPHRITAGVSVLPYIAGSFVAPGQSTSAQILGWLDTGEAVIGVVERNPSKIFFIGDTGGIELVPQPLVDNLIAWGF